MSHLFCLVSCKQKRVASLQAAICGPPATGHGKPLGLGVQSGSTLPCKITTKGTDAATGRLARQRASAILLAGGALRPPGLQFTANKEPKCMTTSKQRTPHPWASPVTRWVQKGANRGGQIAPGLPLGARPRPRGGQTKVPGRSRGSLQARPRETEHPRRRRRRCANEAASPAASAEPLATKSAPADLPGPRPRPGSMATAGRGLAAHGSAQPASRAGLGCPACSPGPPASPPHSPPSRRSNSDPASRRSSPAAVSSSRGHRRGE